jgi:hypothetical protein
VGNGGRASEASAMVQDLRIVSTPGHLGPEAISKISVWTRGKRVSWL